MARAFPIRRSAGLEPPMARGPGLHCIYRVRLPAPGLRVRGPGATALAVLLALLAANVARPGAVSAIPRPIGLYVLDDAANLAPTSKMYPAGLFTDSTYARDIAGHAIFCPIAKIVSNVTP